MNLLLIIGIMYNTLIYTRLHSSWTDYYENSEYISINSRINITESGNYYWAYTDISDLTNQAIFMESEYSTNVSLLVEFSNFKNIFVDIENITCGGAIHFQNGFRFKCTHCLSNNCINAKATIAIFHGGHFCNSQVDQKYGINEVNYSSIVNCGKYDGLGVAPIRLLYGSIKIQSDNISSCITNDTCCAFIWGDTKINLCMISNCSSTYDFDYSTAIVLRYSSTVNITKCNIILNNANLIFRIFASNIYFSDCNIYANTGSYLLSTGDNAEKIYLYNCFLSNPVLMTTGKEIILVNSHPLEFFAPILQFEVKRPKCTCDLMPYVIKVLRR